MDKISNLSPGLPGGSDAASIDAHLNSLQYPESPIFLFLRLLLCKASLPQRYLSLFDRVVQTLTSFFISPRY